MWFKCLNRSAEPIMKRCVQFFLAGLFIQRSNRFTGPIEWNLMTGQECFSFFFRDHREQDTLPAGPGSVEDGVEAGRRIPDHQRRTPGTAIRMAVASSFEEGQLLFQRFQEFTLCHWSLHAAIIIAIVARGGL